MVTAILSIAVLGTLLGLGLGWVARKFRVGIDQIARWNGIDRNKILRPGQKLTMYVDVTAQSS